MGLSVYNIVKWSKMCLGRSIYHVPQNIGKTFSTVELKGYYNDLTEKVTRQPELLDNESLPRLKIPSGDYVDFSVGIFQYGLGAYDLYLQTRDQIYSRKFWQAVQWTMEHQEKDGAWSTFEYIYPNAPYGAMAQGEAISLLLRAYREADAICYRQAATLAVDFMIKSIEQGGCVMYDECDVILKEYTHLPAVLNGWIFAWWGLYDYVLVTGDEKIEQILQASLDSIVRYLPHFTAKYWSLYDLSDKFASPFYHNLHIAQMQAMYKLTGREVFNEYAMRWKKQQRNIICKSYAFVRKSCQKLLE